MVLVCNASIISVMKVKADGNCVFVQQFQTNDKIYIHLYIYIYKTHYLITLLSRLTNIALVLYKLNIFLTVSS